MSTPFRLSLCQRAGLCSTIVLVSSISVAAIASAQSPDQPVLNEQSVTVSQLSDVKPTDWAFTALQSLVERYACIAGNPDRAYKGDRAISRNEFSAGLNTCLDKISGLLSSGLASKVTSEDLAAMKKLQQEFTTEIGSLSSRVDSLEGKTYKLESQPFSPITKFNASVVIDFSSSK